MGDDTRRAQFVRRYARDPRADEAEAADPAASASGLAGTFARVDAIASKVEALVVEITDLRDALEEGEIVLPHMLAYRLATVLARVDHAAAEVVIQQARRTEAEGQLAAFGAEPPEG
jgi:hypothetical protein